ncbi:lipopolysaccharide kinase InaA family protein [Pseudomonas rhizoryzae]|uniref:lipopolysaccharide kinase InaA family protein n=1 Tax=Pseudomonas rhizoryzae TaxID=2571129 RepID=UPI0007364F38|nr:lipopolysaccharide kinase InaA family protein [Pseudomonas rhizoryzae]APQ13456.1 InaA protein [Pseudomonas psychrotolerans]KTT10792.1 InaA protein [Pseudomonas psychrotolerans]KTT20694.1 InaA protein [Pseudomonas psychrotolerans]KTT50125.1 InaA protein [Pseudomonas psychrotolerans]
MGAMTQGDKGFDRWWNTAGDWVEAPNVRRGGESGVQRLRLPDGTLAYVKRQVGHLYRSLRHPLGRPTALRERDALLAFRELGIQVPDLLFCDARQAEGGWRALLVSAALEGYQDLDHWYAEGGGSQLSEAEHERFLATLAGVLARMHRHRWQHGCLYPKHIFVAERQGTEGKEFDVALLDLEKCRQRISLDTAARRDMLQLRRHSSWNAAQWRTLIYVYQHALGRKIRGLES